ncbi:MAG: iron-sulfur cluster assembly scaffold protein [Candidatus Euphemobacter frigidus]|nr:iron-sulfur cluster assembly scaffold protein [Candidatus Euphemobacter frigidus]
MSDRKKLKKIEYELERALLEQHRKVYSPRVIELFQNPVNMGVIPEPNGFGIVRGVCGDTMKVYLRIEDGGVQEVGFETDGCEATIAVGSVATEMARGKTIKEVLAISPAGVIDDLGGLPEDHLHCSILAVNALHNAIANYLLLTGLVALREEGE